MKEYQRFLQPKKIKSLPLFLLLIIGISVIQSCEDDVLEPTGFLLKLSEYNIYQNDLSDLIPNEDYNLYELSSPLFSDYAEKQRLIHVPAGTIATAVDDELLDFPEGTIIVKTFYYPIDKRDLTKGKKIMETRLLIKEKDDWKAATYLWNEAQTDASLNSTGLNKLVSWIDEAGESKAISYQIPSNIACGTCHQKGDKLTPIGPKVRHLNIDVVRNNMTQNQLSYLQAEGTLNFMNPSSFSSMPNYRNTNLTLEERGRAYLDINCASCHYDEGFAASENFRFSYFESLENTNILNGQWEIINQMETGLMPQSGTVSIHTEGLELMKSYLESL